MLLKPRLLQQTSLFEFPAISSLWSSLTSMRDTLVLGCTKKYQLAKSFKSSRHPTRALPASPFLFHNPWYCLRIGIYAADSDPFHFINPSNSNHTSPLCSILSYPPLTPFLTPELSTPSLFLETNINDM